MDQGGQGFRCLLHSGNELLQAANTCKLYGIRHGQKPIQFLLLGLQPGMIGRKNLLNLLRGIFHTANLVNAKPGPAQGSDIFKPRHVLLGVFPVVPTITAGLLGRKMPFLLIKQQRLSCQASCLTNSLRFHAIITPSVVRMETPPDKIRLHIASSTHKAHVPRS